MGKSRTVFVCSNCGRESSKWMGQCPSCYEWNSYVEEVKVNKTSTATNRSTYAMQPISKMTDVTLKEDRESSGIGELDNVLGGGLVKGSLLLIGGDPGIGKSTLIMQLAESLSAKGQKVLYVSGEESASQLKLRANRLKVKGDNIYIKCETAFSQIEDEIMKFSPDLIVIDSIQTIYCDDLSSAAGSVSQVRELTNRLMNISKGKNITTIIIGHVTKDGAIAGPRVLEHMVDTVLYFEGESSMTYRVIRTVKNRFGSSNEIGVFEMTDTGLVEVKNPSKYMLTGKPVGKSGSVVSCAMEGSRPILIEVQGLVSKTNYGMARRSANGADGNRTNLLVAVMEKRLGISMAEYDSYVNVAGGLKVNEPSVDLAIICAIYSSFRNVVIDEQTIIIGEVGLTGEVRGVTQFAKRAMEAKKLGFKRIIAPKVNVDESKHYKGLEYLGVEEVKDALNILLGR